MSAENVEFYIENGLSHVEGWIDTQILRLAGHFSEIMNQNGVTGGACEIGVFKGKFIIGLSHAVDFRDCLAIDIFNNQALNIDNSGGGHASLLEQFSNNAENYSKGRIAKKSADSLSLSVIEQQDIRREFGLFQFFSVDGGHEPEHVANDYDFAEALTHTGGTIIIDDILNPAWPGVIEGVASLFLFRKPKFVPLVLGRNKLSLVNITYHRFYYNALYAVMQEKMPDVVVWKKKFFGHDVLALV